MIASKVRSIHFTDDGATTPQIVPCGLFVQLFRKKLREKLCISKRFFTKVDSNHFHIDTTIVSGRYNDVKMWNDVFIY